MVMASFNGFYVALIIMISFSTLFFKTSLCSEIPQPPSEGPSSDINLAPRPLSSYEQYLSNCASKLKPAECGKEIFKSIFVEYEFVSYYCCLSLVNDVGQTCHFDMTNYAVKLPMFAKNKKEILDRSHKVWNFCRYSDIKINS
jgi:hypothetical protein